MPEIPVRAGERGRNGVRCCALLRSFTRKSPTRTNRAGRARLGGCATVGQPRHEGDGSNADKSFGSHESKQRVCTAVRVHEAAVSWIKSIRERCD